MTTTTPLQFPHTDLSRIGTEDSVPNYMSLRRAQDEINANVLSIHSTRGGGIHGHLGALLSDDDYHIIAGVHYVAPVSPGAHPVHPPGSTGPMIAELNRQHLADQAIFRLHHQVLLAIKNMILKSVHSNYIRELNQGGNMGYHNSGPRELMDHLWQNYGTITSAQMTANNEAIEQPWNTSLPVESVFTQLNDAIVFSTAGGDTITDASAIRTGYKIIEQTGLFTRKCTDWRDKDEPNKTMQAFQAHFRKADIDRRLLGSTTETAGYHGGHTANQATGPTGRTPTTYTYCWSHGSSRNISHTSMSCLNKSIGHKDLATAADHMGGSNKIWTAPAAPVPE
jgi:hypothetical protein